MKFWVQLPWNHIDLGRPALSVTSLSLTWNRKSPKHKGQLDCCMQWKNISRKQSNPAPNSDNRSWHLRVFFDIHAYAVALMWYLQSLTWTCIHTYAHIHILQLSHHYQHHHIKNEDLRPDSQNVVADKTYYRVDARRLSREESVQRVTCGSTF